MVELGKEIRVCEFWVGRAGAGKTHGCLGAIAGELMRSPRGTPLLLLAPEQATAQLERRLATWPGVLGGFTRARVVSFRSLAQLATAAWDGGGGRGLTRTGTDTDTDKSAKREEDNDNDDDNDNDYDYDNDDDDDNDKKRDGGIRGGGAALGPAIGETGRVMLLRRAIRRQRERITVFGASAGQPGLAEKLGATLLELHNYGWTPESIEAWLAGLDAAERATSALARKMADLLLVWRDYEEQLTAGGWSDLPARHAGAVAAIRAWPALAGCRVWMDGFASLTAREEELLEALLGRASGATIALCADPERLGFVRRAVSVESGSPSSGTGDFASGTPGSLRSPGAIQGLPPSGTESEGDVTGGSASGLTPRLFTLAPSGGEAENRSGQTRAGGLVGRERLFENAEATLLKLEQRLTDAGWRTKRVALPREGQSTRFSDAPALAHLERWVLGRLYPRKYEGALHGEDGAAAIEIVEASDRRAEVEAVARRIVGLCRRGEDGRRKGTGNELDGAGGDRDRTGEPIRSQSPFSAGASNAGGDEENWAAGRTLKWREVGVLTRDLRPYEAIVREVFPRFGIPCFIDRRRETGGHPLARLLLTALDAVRGGWAGRSVLHHLKCGLAGLGDADAIARLENHILSSDPERDGWIRLLERDAALSEAWREAREPLEQLERALRKGTNPARALWGLLEDVKAEETLIAWIEAARRAGDEEAAQLHEQAWNQTVAWLNELEALAAADAGVFAAPKDGGAWLLLLDELEALVETALATVKAGLIPPTLNQVTVGAVDRSRTPEIEALFVLGLNEGELPRLWPPDAVLGDSERERLAESGRALGPDARAMRMQEHYLAYIALTRASRRLVLCRPMAGDDGKPADASGVLTAVAGAFADAPRRVVGPDGEGDDLSLGLRPEEWNARLADAVDRLGTPESAAALAGWMAAGDPLTAAGGIDARQREATLAGRRAGWRPREAAIATGTARTALAARGKLSVTALERYGACPFQFFANDLLKLSEREDAGFSAMDLGTIRHGALEKVFHELKRDGGLAWGTIDLEAADRVIDEYLAATARGEDFRRAMQAGRLQTLRLEMAGRELKLAVRALSLAAARGTFAQVAAEWEFGGEELAIDLGGGLRVPVSGKVDRIDAWRPAGSRAPTCVLFDYKSGKRKFSLTRLLGRVDLQLPAYGLALRNKYALAKGEAAAPRIGGFFYWPLSAPLVDATEGDDAGRDDDGPVVEDQWLRECRPDGIFAADLAEALDRGVQPDGDASPVYRFARKRDGDLSRTSTVHWEPERFEQLLAAERRLLGEAMRGIAAGRIALEPVAEGNETACERCAFLTVCRRNALPGGPRFRRLSPYRRESAQAQLDAWGIAAEGARP